MSVSRGGRGDGGGDEDDENDATTDEQSEAEDTIHFEQWKI